MGGFDCYTNFYGMDITRDKLCALVKKWHSLIESFVQAKTTDGYLVRMFAIAFTRRHRHQVKATCYAKASQQKQLRQKMMEIMMSEIQKNSLRELFKKLLYRPSWQVDHQGLLQDLPPRERSHQEGQGAQEVQVRSYQAHGALLRQARGC